MIKRTELEILDQAIHFAKIMQASQDELKLLQEKPMSCAVQEERKCKNTDLEGIKKMYEVRISNLKSTHEAEMDRKIKEAELTNAIMALNNNIELLRWLYRDDMEKNNA